MTVSAKLVGIENPSYCNNRKQSNPYVNGQPNNLTNGNSLANGSTRQSADKPKYVWDSSKESFESMPFLTACTTYLGYYLLMTIGLINHLLFTPKVAQERFREGYPPLYDVFQIFFMRYIYRRLSDVVNRPVLSVPGAENVIKERISKDHNWTFEFTGKEHKCLNLGSYNYLGFASNTGPCCENVIKTLHDDGVALCSSRLELGTTQLHQDLERLTAEFIGVEDTMVIGMGFATNSMNLPALMTPGCLVISDEKNHASIIIGLRLACVMVRVFKHNDMKHLEQLLQEAVWKGQPKTGEPWKKIFIAVEGIFSMEGTIVRLAEIVELKKKYKAYIFLDEAHSIGALGVRGRGAAEYFGLDPNDIDIYMGTFSKNFAAVGGYIAGSKAMVDYLRVNSQSHCYGMSMSPPVARQILSAMKILMGHDGTTMGQAKVDTLARNTKYFRKRLNQIGVIILGHEDSPVVPMMVYLFSKISSICSRLTARNLAVVGVGFPATPFMAGRIRFCISAAHTKEQLDYALKAIEEESLNLGLRYSRRPRDTSEIIY